MNQEIEIIRNPYRNSIEIWVTERGKKDINIQHDGSGNIVEVEFYNGQIPNEVKPFIELPRKLGEEILQSILIYFEKNGIKTEAQSTIQGKLIATEAHLKDMQNITNKLIDNIVR